MIIEEFPAVTVPRSRSKAGRRRGLSANRFTLDAGTERYSLAGHLSRAGFDCFSLDLRGHGASRAAPPGVSRDWSFDTYLHLDVPAALDAVRAETGSDRVLWVGHSLWAVLGMAACGAYPERFAGLVGLAGPVRFGANPDLKRYVRHGFLLGGRVNRWLARRRPRGPVRLPPVLLCHGLSANRFKLDAGTERYSLAAHLSRAGFDSFSLDLRGHGASRAAPPGVAWTGR